MRCILFAFVAVFSVSTAAFACSPALPECPLENGGTAYMESTNAGAVLFREVGPPDASTKDAIILVECKQRTGVRIPVDGMPYETEQKAWGILSDALFTEKKVTIRQIARSLKRSGVAAEQIKLSGSHCGCSLPILPAPRVSCPDF